MLIIKSIYYKIVEQTNKLITENNINADVFYISNKAYFLFDFILKNSKKNDDISIIDSIYETEMPFNKIQKLAEFKHRGNRYYYTNILDILYNSKLLLTNKDIFNLYEYKTPTYIATESCKKYYLNSKLNIESRDLFEYNFENKANTNIKTINENDFFDDDDELEKMLEDIKMINIDINKIIEDSKSGALDYLNDTNYTYNISKINSIIDKNVRIKKGKNVDRVYHNITAISSWVLKYVTYKDETLCELDVANCFPLLSNYFINNEKFRIDCENGNLYENILKSNLSEATGLKVENVKKYLLILLSGTNDIPAIVKSTLNNYNINIYDDIKNYVSAQKTKYKNFSLSKKLQNAESNIFINIYKNNKDKICITRHDSLLVLVQDKEYFKNEIEKSFKEIGLNVYVRSKVC